MNSTVRLFIGVGLGVLAIAAGVWLTEGRFGTRAASNATGQIWTCSMHPQIRMDHPDRCPLCGMDLVPVSANQQAGKHASHLVLSPQARAMASVQTAPIKRQPLTREIRTVGKVELDETRVAYIAARVNGRVDEVFASFPGTVVRKDDHLVSIYSPELYATQEAFLANYRREQEDPARKSNAPSLTNSSRDRLKLWGLTEAQIEELARTGKAQTHLVVYSPIGGTVLQKSIRPGQYVKEGDALFTVADLSQVWVILEIYESDLAWVRFGQTAEVTLESDPANPLTGRIGFVEPVLNEASRTVRVRTVLDNRAGKLKPGMYAQAAIRVPLRSDGGVAPTGLEGKYACIMHPYLIEEKPGNCSVCRMPLEQIPGKPEDAAAADAQGVLAVPTPAVLTTGKRQIVYVETEPGVYRPVEPTLGPRAGDYYPVLGGLKEGDLVVVRGNFLLDSQSQIAGHPSLLYPQGAPGGSGHGAHSHAVVDPKHLENIRKLGEVEQPAALAQQVCPISLEPLGSMGKPVKFVRDGKTVYLCCAGCADAAAEKKDAELFQTAPRVDTSKKEHKSADHGAHQHD